MHAKVAANRECLDKLVSVGELAASQILEQIRHAELLEQHVAWTSKGEFNKIKVIAERQRRTLGHVC